MASGSDRDADDALSKLLQMGTVAEYESKFVILVNRVTRISTNLLKSIYISGLKLALQCALLRSYPITLGEAFSLARATEACFTDLQLWELLRSNSTTLGEAFFRACITEDRFEAIVGKELNIKEKLDTNLSWPSEEAPPVIKRPLDANEYTILSLRSEDPNLNIQEKAVKYVRALNVAPLEVVFAGPFDICVDEVGSAIDDVFDIGKARGVNEDELNRVISVLKDEGGEIDDRLDEINLILSQEFVIRILESRDVFGGSLIGFLKWVYCEKNCEVFSVTSRWESCGSGRW
ncbi:hypothetical protein Tco_0313779 [Tanacetum coccineum]